MKRAGKALLGLFLGLVIAEFLLRAAGFVYLWVNERGPALEARAGGIVCVGDSNTFGLYLPPEEAYPRALERLLQANVAGAPAVLNLGIPGMGADHVARNLPGQLAKHEPRIVIALAGVNNTWSHTDWRDSSAGRFVSGLRLVKFFQLLAARDGLAVEQEALRTEPGGGFRPTGDAMGLIDYRRSAQKTAGGSVFRLENRAGEKIVFEQEHKRLAAGAYRAAIANRFEVIVDLCRDAGAEPVMLTYPFRTPVLTEINRTLRQVARRKAVLLVDLERELAPYVEGLGIDELAFPDRHPRALATELMAHLIYNALRAQRLIDGPYLELPAVDGLRARSGERTRSLELRAGKLVIHGRHGDGVRLLFSTELGEHAVGGVATGLATSELFEDTKEMRSLYLPIGVSGEIELGIPAHIHRSARRRAVFVVAVFGTQNGRGRFDHVSRVVEIPAR